MIIARSCGVFGSIAFMFKTIDSKYAMRYQYRSHIVKTISSGEYHPAFIEHKHLNRAAMLISDALRRSLTQHEARTRKHFKRIKCHKRISEHKQYSERIHFDGLADNANASRHASQSRVLANNRST